MKYYLEYSPKQKAYNIGTLREIITVNFYLFRHKMFNDYVIIAESESQKELSDKAQQLKEKYGRP